MHIQILCLYIHTYIATGIKLLKQSSFKYFTIYPHCMPIFKTEAPHLDNWLNAFHYEMNG